MESQIADSHENKLRLMGKFRRLLFLLFKAALIATILVAVGSYIYFCPPVLTRLNGGFILFPIPPGPEYKFDTINGIRREEVFFKNSNGDRLNGWFFQLPEPQAPVILINHGNAGNIGHRLLLVQHLINAGASVFVYDYRGFGLSSGTKSLSGLIEDAESAFDYLTKTRQIPPSQIVVYGESVGGGPSCLIANSNAVDGIILDSTFTSLLSIAKQKVGVFCIYPDFLQPYPAFNNIAELTTKRAPLLLIHGKQDNIIPLSEAQKNFAAAADPKTLVVLPNSSHNWKDMDFGVYEAGVKKFLFSLKIQQRN